MNCHSQASRISTPSSDTMLDPWDSLQAACNDADLWPENSIASQSFRQTTRSYQQQLRAESTRLFNTNRNTAFIELIEAFDGPFRTTQCRTLDDLRGHFQINRKDPRCRHVFFSARHSRAPMYCSKEMFDLVMTFHQTMPPFVDLVLGFGKPRSEQEFHYASFRSENYIGVSQGRKRAIPQLGRSGREIRHCFNLWSPEKSEASGSMTWPLRQAAAYHAFDVESGQSLWINFKANDVVKARIIDATASCDSFHAESLSRLSGSFAATLTTHLILFEWCSENWRWYNKNLEEKLRDILDKVNNAPVEQVEGVLKYDAKMLVQTLRDNPQTLSPKPPATRQNSISSWAPSSPVRKMSRALTGLTTNTVQSTEHRSLSASVPLSPLIGPPRDSPTKITGEIQSEQDQDPFEVLQDFSIERLQCLNGIGADLHTSRLVMKLNADIMKEILTHYQSLWDDGEFPHDIKDGCKYSFLEFIRRTKSMVRSLEMEIARIGTLMLLLNDGRELVCPRFCKAFHNPCC